MEPCSGPASQKLFRPFFNKLPNIGFGIVRNFKWFKHWFALSFRIEITKHENLFKKKKHCQVTKSCPELFSSGC